jgi:aryl sulfotransferase
MRILHNGYGKSGNNWLYAIVRKSLDAAGHPEQGYWREHPCNLPLQSLGYVGLVEGGEDIDCIEVGPHSFMFELGRTSAWAPIIDVEEYVSKCRQIWTHAHPTDRLGEMVRRVDKVVCIVRDVRDVVVSGAHYPFAPGNVRQYPQFRQGWKDPQEYLDSHFRGVIHDWARHVYGFLRRLDEWPLHIVLYERLLNQFDAEYDRLLDFLGLELDDQQKRMIKEQVSFDSMRRGSPEHLRAGSRNQWRKALTKAQIDEAEIVAGPLLRLLGYPSAGDVNNTDDPEIPATLDWHGWRDDPWPHADPDAFTYPDLVRVYSEVMGRIAADSVHSVAGWGGNVCGRAMVDAAQMAGIDMRYLIDRNTGLQGQRVGGVPVVSPDAVGVDVPFHPIVLGGLRSVIPLEAEARHLLRGQRGLGIYAPIPGRGPVDASAQTDSRRPQLRVA